MNARTRTEPAARPENNDRVLVYGASGHTGRFVLADLLRRGLCPILAGRDAERLSLPSREAPAWPRSEVRVATVDDSRGLRRAMDGVAAVINCAGPFLDTALPVADAAVRTGVHYLDIAAEQEAARSVHREYDASARAAGVTVVPAMGFYGGLADLLATVALDGRADASEITVAVGLDRWWPTEGTRRTGRRNTVPRVVIRDGRLVPMPDPPSTGTWTFPEPLGDQPVVEVPFSEAITLQRHLSVGRLRSYLNTAPLEDLGDVNTPAPSAVDEYGRSAQRFVVDVEVTAAAGGSEPGDGGGVGPERNGGAGCAGRGSETGPAGASTRRARVSGRDIYAVTAPLVGEAVSRLLDGRSTRVGAAAPSEAFDASDFLRALPPEALRFTRP